MVQVFTSLLVGLATWLCFLSIGVQHAAVWGLAAGVLNFVPYIGSIVFTGASAAVGLMQFGNLESAVLIAGMFGFTKRDFFDAEPEASNVPNVDLSLS